MAVYVPGGILMYMKRQPIVGGQKIGRNSPCPCESGLKYKDCHGSEKFRHICQVAANDAAQRTMMMLIQQMQAQKGICPKCKERFTNNRCTPCGIDFITKEEANRRIEEEDAAKSIVLPTEKKLILPSDLKG